MVGIHKKEIDKRQKPRNQRPPAYVPPVTRSQTAFMRMPRRNPTLLERNIVKANIPMMDALLSPFGSVRNHVVTRASICNQVPRRNGTSIEDWLAKCSNIGMNRTRKKRKKRSLGQRGAKKTLSMHQVLKSGLPPVKEIQQQPRKFTRIKLREKKPQPVNEDLQNFTSRFPARQRLTTTRSFLVDWSRHMEGCVDDREDVDETSFSNLNLPFTSYSDLNISHSDYPGASERQFENDTRPDQCFGEKNPVNYQLKLRRRYSWNDYPSTSYTPSSGAYPRSFGFTPLFPPKSAGFRLRLSSKRQPHTYFDKLKEKSVDDMGTDAEFDHTLRENDLRKTKTLHNCENPDYNHSEYQQTWQNCPQNNVYSMRSFSQDSNLNKSNCSSDLSLRDAYFGNKEDHSSVSESRPASECDSEFSQLNSCDRLESPKLSYSNNHRYKSLETSHKSAKHSQSDSAAQFSGDNVQGIDTFKPQKEHVRYTPEREDLKYRSLRENQWKPVNECSDPFHPEDFYSIDRHRSNPKKSEKAKSKMQDEPKERSATTRRSPTYEATQFRPFPQIFKSSHSGSNIWNFLRRFSGCSSYE